MQEINHSKSKIYYSMGEVAEMFDVNPSLLRFWEQEFDVLKPHRNKKGNRLFTPEDVDNVRIIYHLLKERKMKIEVARKYIKDYRKDVDRDAEIMERLMNIRAILLEVKQDLAYDGQVVDDPADASAEYSMPVKPMGKSPKGSVSGNKKRTTEEVVAAVVSSGEAMQEDDAESQPIKAAVPPPAFVEADDLPQSLTMTEAELNVEVTVDVKPPFQEQVLFEVAVPLELMQNAAAQQAEEDGFESAKAAFIGADASVADDAVPEEKPKPQIIEQTLF